MILAEGRSRRTPGSKADVLVDRLVIGRGSLVTNAIVVTAAVVFIALLAQVRIPLGFTPVPISGQTFGVLLIGPALGGKRAAVSLGIYLILGAIGLPIFTDGQGGMTHLFGPTGGYLIGFVAAAGVLGALAERRADRRITSSSVAMVIGSAVIYLFGILGLMLASDLSLASAVTLGVVPFLIGDILKAALAAAALPSAWAIVRWADRQGE